jgi:hypothetical protein
MYLSVIAEAALRFEVEGCEFVLRLICYYSGEWNDLRGCKASERKL